MAKNDITGDSIFSKKNSKDYEDNYDLIFKKRKYPIRDAEWNEDRIDIIGSNGNDGLHYDESEIQEMVDKITHQTHIED